MTEPMPENTQPTDSGGINPAWNEALSGIPAEFHGQLTPVFSKWDKNVEDRVGRVHSDYAPYKAYEPFIQNQIPFEQVQQGYGILRALQENPAQVIEAIQQAYNLQAGVVEEQGNTELGDGQYAQLPPEIQQQLQQQQQMLDTMGRLMLKQREDALAAAEMESLESKLSTLRTTHGDFNQQVVLSLALQMNNDLDAAFKVYQDDLKANGVRRGPNPPRLLMPGGSAPENAVDPRKLDSRGRQDLVVDILKAAHGANNQH